MTILNMDQRQSRPQEDTIQYSPFQSAIFKEIEETDNNIIVQAVAGSGKTTTILHALELVPTGKSAIFVAFNKSVADELAKKVPPFVEARTLHAVGMGLLRANYKHIKVNGKKATNILRFDMLDNLSNPEIREWYYTNVHEIGKMVSRVKGACITDPDRVMIENLIFDCDIDLPTDHWSMTTYLELIKRAWVYTGEKGGAVIDFDDMLALPVLRSDEMSFPKYDYVFVDEVQDLNHVQREFVSLLLGEQGRLIAVGDTHQAIYGFRGADHNSMDLMKRDFNCKEMPLSICYRCDSDIVAHAQFFVHHIEERAGAAPGIVDELEYGRHWEHYKAGDHILCRLNAPLVKEALSLAMRGHNVCILGKDLVGPLIKISKAIEGKYDGINSFTIDAYYKEAVEDLPEGKEYKAYAIMDRCQVLSYIVGTTTMQSSSIKKVLDDIFSDKPPVTSHIALSTIHKAKGLEADRVFILAPDKLPHPLAKSAAEVQQEDNLHYVAITRAKHELYYINEVG